MSGGLVVRAAEVGGELVDVRVAGGRIAAVAGRVAAEGGDEVVDAGGGALLPGLHDHHVHLMALAAAERSVEAGPPAVADAGSLARALRAADAALERGRWLRGVGYHESVAGPLDRWALDALVPGRPARVQHRSGALWVLNSAAVAATGLDDAPGAAGVERGVDGRATGRLWRLDAWLRERVPPEPVDLAAAGRRLGSRGVTGVTDATPTDDLGSLRLLASAAASGALPLRVRVTGGPGADAGAAPELDWGPVKLLLPDHEPPALANVVAGVRAARSQGRAVAIHCVTAVAAVLAVAAVEEVGAVPGDRIEHGAVIPVGLAERIADLGVAVVTNPGFVRERGERYLEEVDERERADLWRCRSLLGHGVAVGGGTDAPFGRPDPWSAVAAATDRRTAAGRSLNGDERIPAERAVALFLTPLERPGGQPRQVVPGAPADLCLLATPLRQALADPASTVVAATVAGGVLRRW